MTDHRGFVARGWLGLASLSLVVIVACGGAQTAPPAPEMEAAAADAGLTSDFVPRPLPNPTSEVILNWAPLPDGRVWGSTAGIDIGPDGHVWAYDRCGGGLDGGCEANPELDPIFKFDRDTGEVLTSFGAGLFVTPHGFHVDSDGNVWATDFSGNEAGTKGHQVIKFSPEGEVLMRLGEAGVPGSGPGQLNQPCDVITAPNGDIFISDGHSGQSPDPPPGATGRILKFDKDGNFIKEWARSAFGLGSSARRTRWSSTHRAACISPIAATTASRSSTRMETSSRSTRSTAGSAGCSSRTTTHSMRSILNRA